MSARFQVYCSVSETSGAVPAPTVVRWRLMSENGRPLATGPGAFDDLEAAVAGATLAREAAVTGTVLFATPDRTGWGWYLVVPGAADLPPLAVSPRRFARRVECTEAVARFRALAPAAPVVPRLVVFRRATGSAAPQPNLPLT